LFEEWRDLPGFEDDYEISSMGRVRTKPKIKSIHVDKQGRFFFTVTKNGKTKTIYVHAAVAAAFIGPRPPGLVVCHGDGDPGHNTPGNLRYDTQKANAEDRDKHGRTMRGEHQKNAKLTDQDIRDIRSLDDRQEDIASHYNISQSLVSAIKRRKAWAHV